MCVHVGVGWGGGGSNITHSAVEASTFSSSDISLDVSGFWVVAKHFCRFRNMQDSVGNTCLLMWGRHPRGHGVMSDDESVVV